jgi:hypothetical protein
MKSLRFALRIVLLSVSAAFAQSDAHEHSAPPAEPRPAESDAQKSFDKLKTLAGNWQGPVTVVPSDNNDNKPAQISTRLTSRGNAIVHEAQEAGTPLDPTKYDHPVTMFYLDGDRLTLVHYCDAGNRPRMTARTSPDGKTVEFDFVDLSGGNQYGHMDHALFTFIDADHHIEDWTYMLPGDKPVHAHMDLQRTK